MDAVTGCVPHLIGSPSSLSLTATSCCSTSYNTVLALKDGEWNVETVDKLPEGSQPQISVEELLLCEDIIRADERVVQLAKEVGA